jgi:hypothetical protein
MSSESVPDVTINAGKNHFSDDARPIFSAGHLLDAVSRTRGISGRR